MCDCYYGKCMALAHLDKELGPSYCEKLIPIHIEDFNYPREDVEVYCEKHIPKEHVTVFTLKDFDVWGKGDYEYDIGWICGIRLQGGKIEPNSVGIYPNIAANFDVEIR